MAVTSYYLSICYSFRKKKTTKTFNNQNWPTSVAVISTCVPNPCMHGGRCVYRPGKAAFACKCTPKFAGQLCETSAGDKGQFHVGVILKRFKLDLNVLIFKFLNDKNPCLRTERRYGKLFSAYQCP